MDEKIPAGTMVKIGKQEGTVISHGDGVVHVDIDGDEVSVSPSQIEIVPLSKGQSGKDSPESKKKDEDELDDENSEANAAS